MGKRGEQLADESTEKKKKQKDNRETKESERLQLEDGEKPPGDSGGNCSDREDGDADEDEEDQQKPTSIEYDPTDKESMLKTVSKMVKQLKNIAIQMEVVQKELLRAEKQLPQQADP